MTSQASAPMTHAHKVTATAMMVCSERSLTSPPMNMCMVYEIMSRELIATNTYTATSLALMTWASAKQDL
jgi:hypothetical protein